MISKKEVLEKAITAVADRGIQYDDPIDNFQRIAALWRAHLRNRYPNHQVPVLGTDDVSIMMILVKLARLEYDSSHLDSWTDAAGYAACGAHCTVKID